MHPLDGPRLKVARAISEVNRLGLLENAFRESTHYHVIRAEFNKKSGQDVYRIRVDDLPPSKEWGIFIGEITHNLRSALNHLVYQLALLNSTNKAEAVAGDRRLQFPIFLKSKQFKPKGQNGIKLLLPKHQTSIKRLQPYKRSNGVLFKTIDLAKCCGRNSPLFWLEEINNADKHRLLQVVAIRLGIGTVIDGSGYNAIKRSFSKLRIIELKNGAKFCEASPEMDVNASVSPVIAFAQTCRAVNNMGVLYVLEGITEYVSEVIESFASEF